METRYFPAVATLLASSPYMLTPFGLKLKKTSKRPPCISEWEPKIGAPLLSSDRALKPPAGGTLKCFQKQRFLQLLFVASPRARLGFAIFDCFLLELRVL